MKRENWWLLIGIFVVLYGVSVTAVKGEELVCSNCHEKLTQGRVVHPALEEGCDACHEVELVEKPKKGEPPHTVTPIDDVNDLCSGCHDVPEDLENVHSPIEDEGCTFCHDPHSSGQDFLLRSPPYDLCGQCHRSALPTAYASRHKPVLERCGFCHDVHGSAKDTYLKKSSPDLCLECHTKIQKEIEAENPHPPAEEDCLNCHKPHASLDAYLLNAYFPKDPYAYYTPVRYDLCWQCHDREEIFGEDSGFRTALGKNLHAVHVKQKKGRVCTFCHSPHGSSQSFMLKTQIPFGKHGWVIPLQFRETEKGGTCGPSCHESRSFSR